VPEQITITPNVRSTKNEMKKTHYLKTVQPYFEMVGNRLKPFEVRKNDRNFEEGDEVYLQEYDPKAKTYSGHQIRCEILYVLKDFPAIKKDYVVFGIKITQLIVVRSHT